MRRLVFVIVISLASLQGFAQYDSVLSTIIPVPAKRPVSLGEFEIKHPTLSGEKFSMAELQADQLSIFYVQRFSASPHQKCGMFIINGIPYPSEYPEPYNDTFGCELDELSIEAFQYQLGKNKYLILTAISEHANGRGTRVVFLNLFDITNLSKVKHYSFWSLYGSALSFNDFNHDSKIDFLEARYDYPNDNDQARIRITPLCFDKKKGFVRDTTKYILFETTGEVDPPAKLITKSWYD